MTAFEETIQRGSTGSPAAAADIGLSATTPRCDITVSGAYNDPDGQTIECAVKGNPKVAGSTITLERTSSGQWPCDITAGGSYDAKYNPAGCTGG